MSTHDQPEVEWRERPQPLSLWRNRDYLLLWSGQSISAVGSRVSGIVFPLLVLELTRSAAQAGLVGALFAPPYPLFGLPGGALIDRWNRKRVMLVCDTGRALNMASIPLYLVISAPLLLGALTGMLWMIGGCANLVQGTYRRALLPDELQGRVNSVFELLELGADALSVALTGLLLQTIGVRPALLVLLAWLAVQALLMSLNPHVRKAPPLAQTQPI